MIPQVKASETREKGYAECEEGKPGNKRETP